MTDSEQVAAFAAFLREAEERNRIAGLDEAEAFQRRQDIEHRLELYDDTFHTTARLGKLLRQAGRQRRAAKETQETLAPLLQWAAEHRSALHALERTLGAMRKAEERQKMRVYTPRTDVLEDIE